MELTSTSSVAPEFRQEAAPTAKLLTYRAEVEAMLAALEEPS